MSPTLNETQIREACAEAIGWTHLGAVGVLLRDDERRGSIADTKYPGKLWCLSGSNDWWRDPEGNTICAPCQGIPDPLTDDAAAMALVKKLELSIGRNQGVEWDVENRHSKFGERYVCVMNADLNRAICECVAQMFSLGSTSNTTSE